MRFPIVGFVVCQIIVQSQTENFSGADNAPRNKKNNEDEILQFSESRYRLNNPYLEYTKREPDLPVTFQAPLYEANDYWNHRREKDDYDNRRTFFEDAYSTRTTFPGFYQFMTSLFTGRDDISSTPFQVNRNHPTPPYPFERPFGFRPTTNYIPPPKPIRASVIKLETVTRSPNLYPSFFYDSVTRNSPHLESILNQVLIENSKKHHPDDLSFHYQPDPVSPVVPPSVLPKPIYVSPTTLRPFLDSRFTDNHTRGVTAYRTFHHGRRYNSTGHRYPDSVQDQLPHLNIGEVKIPYVSETALTNIFTTLPPSNTKTYFKYSRNPFPYSPTNISGSLQWVRPTSRRKERPTTYMDRIRYDVSTEPTKDLIAVKKRKQSEKPSVELITNLTVEGLSKVEKDNANIHNYVNYFNIRNLISYEMEKLDTQEPESQTTTHLVNLNDELSLDAKILKDTNWDGFTGTTSAATTTAAKREFTATNKTEGGETTFEPDLTTTTIRFSSESTEKETNPTTQTVMTETTTGSVGTTTEITTTEYVTTTTTSNPITTTEQIQNSTTQTAEHRTDVIKLTTAEPTPTEVDPSSTTTERAFHFKRKYNRRPKISNFTPYPTTNELQKKVINRNNFPKRQKPNITLSFGNKNIIKTRENYRRDEVMRFSDEDVAKRKRKIGKRRQVIKRTRTTTSERSTQK